jgi:two-component system NtrC family sensor kinase
VSLEKHRKHPPERGWLALNDVVTESIELVAYALRIDGIDVRVDVAGDLPRLWADRHELQQVLVNLLTNAHHAMRESPSRQLLVETRHDVGRGRVALRISDSGPGVPEAFRDRIFEPFFTTKPVGQGTGLGLSVCRSIVEAHGGTLTLERDPLPGAVFRIELPVEHRERTVLVVDDEPPIVDMLVDMLSAEGYRAEPALTGAAALDKLASQTYDVVLTDVRMPDLDGIELYLDAPRVCRGARPPFVFMTGDLFTGSTRSFLEGTAAVCLAKPFRVEDVRRALAEVEETAHRA